MKTGQTHSIHVDLLKDISLFMPEGWKELCYSSGAIKRERNFSADQLFVTLLIHCLGFSLRSTSMIIDADNIATASDSAINYHLENSFEWIAQINCLMMNKIITTPYPHKLKGDYKLAAIDATTVNKPKAEGTTWRIHVIFDLLASSMVNYIITDNKTGEKFANFDLLQKVIYLCDRAYCTAASFSQAFSAKAFIISRMCISTVKLLCQDTKERVDLLEVARHLNYCEYTEISAYIADKTNSIMLPVRACIFRLPEDEVEKSQEKARKNAKADKRKASENCLEAAKYVFLLTNLPREEFTTQEIIDFYRFRWQIELAFKMMKSLIEFDQLKKFKPETALPWLHMKLFLALLIQTIIEKSKNQPPIERKQSVCEQIKDHLAGSVFSYITSLADKYGREFDEALLIPVINEFACKVSSIVADSFQISQIPAQDSSSNITNIALSALADDDDYPLAVSCPEATKAESHKDYSQWRVVVVVNYILQVILGRNLYLFHHNIFETVRYIASISGERPRKRRSQAAVIASFVT